MSTVNKLRTEVTVNWERIPLITGRILRIDSQEVDGPQGKELVPYMLVDTKERFCRVYKSAALEEAFDVATVGDMVHIESLGLRTTKSQRQCRQFDIRVWTDDTMPPVEPPKVKRMRPAVDEPAGEEGKRASKSRATTKR